MNNNDKSDKSNKTERSSRGDRTPRQRQSRPRREPEGKGPGPFNWKRGSKTGIFWIALILLAILAMQALSATKVTYTEIKYTEFLQQVDAGNVATATFVERWLQGDLITPLQNKPGEKPAQFKNFKTLLPPRVGEELLDRLEKNNVEISAETEGVNWTQIIFTIGPWILLMAFFWLFMFRQMQGGGTKGIFSFGKSRAIKAAPNCLPRIARKSRLMTSPEPKRPKRNFRRSLNSSRTPANSSVSEEKFLRERCCWVRRERGRRYWPARLPARRACRFSP